MRSWNNIQIDGSVEFSHLDLFPNVRTRRTSNHETATYEDSILRLLHQFDRNPVGRAVLRAIFSAAPRLVLIIPGTGRRMAAEHAISHAPRVHGRHRVFDNIVPATIDGTAAGAASEVGTPGTGRGADAVVFFIEGPCLHDVLGPPDEVLGHELVHALRDLRGHKRPAPTHDQFQTLEEFIAMLVLNMYASAQGSHILRTDHRQGVSEQIEIRNREHHVSEANSRKIADRGVLGPLLSNTSENPFTVGTQNSDSAQFARQNARYLGQLLTDEPMLCIDLSQVPCSFNPIREYTQNRSPV